MKGLFEVRLDLGVRRLVPEYRVMLGRQHLREDVVAGLAVASVSIPFSLAIAMASGVPPGVGLVTAVVAGVVAALFGGAPLAVTGPAAAMAVLIASVVQAHGLRGLLVVGLGCGLLQLVVGVLGLGRLLRLIPVSVVEGFTAGIGAVLLISQLPRMLGLPPPPEAHVVDVITHISDLLHHARPAPLAIALATLGLTLGLPRAHKRLPVETVGDVPRALPAPHVPAMPAGQAWGAVVSTSLVVFALASLESLLASSALDKLVRGPRHDPDQELIGQGLGNIASALVGGIPVTSVVARSTLNAEAGARTRRAAVVQAIAIAAVMLAFAPVVGRVPIAALAGVLFAVALRMLDPRKLAALARVSRGDAIVYAITFALIVLTDLKAGVQWGVVVALAVAAVRIGQTHLHLPDLDDASRSRFELGGPITSLASLKIEALRASILQAQPGSAVILDLSKSTAMDATGAELLIELVAATRERAIQVAVLGLRPDLLASARAADPGGALDGVLAATEQDVITVLADGAPVSGRQRLALGVERYRREHLPRFVALYERLAKQQTPHTFFITCSDSRIQPALLTSTDPGELFLARNVGNMVPPYADERPPAGGAALEYAVGVLGVREIVVCAHSRCGAIHALLHPETVPSSLRSLGAWLVETEARDLCAALPKSLAQDDVARLNALRQLDHLRTYPAVAERLAAGSVRLHAWFFDVATGEVEEYEPDERRWRPLTGVQVRLGAPAPAEGGAAAPAPPPKTMPAGSS
jgi:carbonic anhydrase